MITTQNNIIPPIWPTIPRDSDYYSAGGCYSAEGYIGRAACEGGVEGGVNVGDVGWGRSPQAATATNPHSPQFAPRTHFRTRAAKYSTAASAMMPSPRQPELVSAVLAPRRCRVRQPRHAARLLAHLHLWGAAAVAVTAASRAGGGGAVGRWWDVLREHRRRGRRRCGGRPT